MGLEVRQTNGRRCFQSKYTFDKDKSFFAFLNKNELASLGCTANMRVITLARHPEAHLLSRHCLGEKGFIFIKNGKLVIVEGLIDTNNAQKMTRSSISFGKY